MTTTLPYFFWEKKYGMQNYHLFLKMLTYLAKLVFRPNIKPSFILPFCSQRVGGDIGGVDEVKKWGGHLRSK